MTLNRQFRIVFIDILTLVVASVPALLLSFYSLQEPWALYRISRAVGSVALGSIPTYSTSASAYHAEHLGSEILFSALYHSSNWHPHWLALLPIGGLFSVLVYFAIAETISQSKFNAIALALYIGWYYPRLYSQYAVQTYAWTNNLFIGFLILLYHWLNERRPIYSVLIFIIFVVNFFFYQTTPVWMIIATAFSVLALKLKERTSIHTTWAIPLFMVVFYFAFDTIFYGNYLAHLRSETTNEALYQNFFSKIIIPLFQKSDQKLAPFVVSPVNPPLATYLILISLLIMIVPVGYWVVQKAIFAVKQREPKLLISSEKDIFIWSVLLVNLTHMFGYLGYGAVSTRVIPLVFPVLLLMIVRKASVQRYLLGSLVLVSVLSFVSFILEFKPDQKLEDLGISGRLIRDSSTVLADANIFALLQLQSIQEQKLIDFAWVNPEKYVALVNQNDITKYPIDYWALDKSGKPVITFQWVFMEPWNQNYDEIEKNPYLNKIYDSERLALFQPIRSPLPEHIDNWQEKKVSLYSFPVNAVSILVSMLAIFLLPGFIFMLIIKPAIRIYHFISFCGISSVISLCVVILIGYLLNFLSLLNFLVPIVLVISGVAVLALMINRRRLLIKLLNPFFGINLILMLIFTCYWALAVTSVAHARAAVTQGFTEFYITETIFKHQEVIEVNISNNCRDTNTYRLIIGQGNNQREYFPISIESGDTKIYQFLRKNLLEKQITLTLVDSHGKKKVLFIRE